MRTICRVSGFRLFAAGALSLGLVHCGGEQGGQRVAKGASETSRANSGGIGDLAVREGGLSGFGKSTPTAQVSNTTLRLDQMEEAIQLDGVPGEWAGLVDTRAMAGATQATFRGAIQVDGSFVYVAGEIQDSITGADHASLILSFPSPGGVQNAYEIELTPGKPGETEGTVRNARTKKDVAGASIVEAPTKTGATFEAKIPWSTFPEARTTRIGLRGALRYYDGSAVLATGPGDTTSTESLSRLPTESELALREGLLEPRGLTDKPDMDLYSDVRGDAQKERVSIYKRLLTISGPGYRNGREYFFRDLGADVVSFELRDVTGSGKADLLIRKRYGDNPAREVFEVWSLAGGDTPETIFSHEVAVHAGSKRVSNSVHIANKEITVTLGTAEGWDEGSLRLEPLANAETLLVPWKGPKSRRFEYKGQSFAKVSEEAGDARGKTGGPATPQTSTVTSSRPATVQEPKQDPEERLVAAFRKDRAHEGEAFRVDVRENVWGKGDPERVVVAGRDVAVWGKGYQEGKGYAFMQLSMFQSAADIADVSLKDVTGDGLSEILVRGFLPLAQGKGPDDTVQGDVLFVYHVLPTGLSRVFSVELGRKMGKKQITGMHVFGTSPKVSIIELRPGKATNVSEKDCPWQEEPPGKSVEPLLFPWSKTKSLRYKWNGATFARE
ncbi:MAG: hypothetical protein KBF88_05745 [Polyangiaceae bacterium]|nr:hypothetical protein [Polyangiaceae bacterium]